MPKPYRGSMAELDLSSLSDAELQAMKTNLLAAHPRTLNAKSYQIGSRSLSRESGESILKQLASVSAEIAARADQTGGTAVAEFGEPE